MTAALMTFYCIPWISKNNEFFIIQGLRAYEKAKLRHKFGSEMDPTASRGGGG